ncbi:hypothetical protein B0J13DRAFT_639758 [Dactylonectria estremocensis]|uniref:MOSC domain-containing protein n=1 Tax=Dactylonectria estremocensis TaxID=1079267 RepID=A0A9P9EH43_9HYPO|nr:hypothetical protein B0J13DRAFT_639758 [Dactylonectria estremocensis]
MLLQVLQCLQGALKASTASHVLIAVIFLLGLVFAVVIQTERISTTREELKHLRRLSLSSSNMADQFDPKFDAREGIATEPVRIQAIYIHPVKSCKPIEVDRAMLTKTGFMYDRCFAFATEITTEIATANTDEGSKWRFISQRTKPMMSQIITELWLPENEENLHNPLVQAGGCVVISFRDPDAPGWIRWLEGFYRAQNPTAAPQISFIAPLQPTVAQIDKLEITPKIFTIHDRDAKGLDMGGLPSVAAALPKLKKFLGIPKDRGLTLLKCTPDTLTRTTKNLAPLDNIGSPAIHGYTDQQPVNINSLSSIHAVSALLPPENQPLNALRFRANLWITGAPAYEEESWKRCRILPKAISPRPRADVAPTLSVVCRTSRCTMPNVDPSKGIFTTNLPPPDKDKGKPQPSTTLKRCRTVENGNKMALGYIGMHCVPEDRSLKEAAEQKAGLYVEVGDEIEVLERGAHLYGSTGNDY